MAHEMTSGTALEEPGESLEVVLSSAFSGGEGTEKVPEEDGSAGGDVQESTEIDPLLLKIVPARKPVDFHALEEEASRHRLILVRTGAVISVAALVSVVGAFLYHAVIIGVLWVGALLMPAPQRGGAGGHSLETGLGGIMTTEGPNTPSASPAPAVGGTNADPGVALPKVPPVVQPLPSRDAVAINTLENQPDPDIIAIPSGETALGRLKVTPPEPRVVAPPEPIISPPNHSESATPVIAAAGAPTASNLVRSVGGTGAGGSGDDDEAPISWANDSGGNGKGGAAGRGHGHLMGGDLPEPFPYETPDLDIKLTAPPKHDHMKYDVTVAADGRLVDVKLTESSGEADLDELWRRQILEHWRYHPAHVNGKFIQATTSVIIRLTSR